MPQSGQGHALPRDSGTSWLLALAAPGGYPAGPAWRRRQAISVCCPSAPPSTALSPLFRLPLPGPLG